ncbi:MAG: class I SAM-dependent rRNA methyltransferase [Nitrospirae bacterium]|nr:class I SAM-dependent rRNA methyltransferase [Nitrospirota bacterium]
MSYGDSRLKIPEIKIEKKCAKRVLSGHLWIFDNEITSIDGNYTNGDVVKVFTQQGRFVGKGYINAHSKIAVRILSFQDAEINREFIYRRIEDALKYRLSLGYNINGSFRVVFSEGDLLPGLIVDKYEDKLSLQILTLGMDMWRGEIVKILTELFNPMTIIERSEVEVRKKEGLEPVKGILYGKDEVKTVVSMDGMSFEIDLMEGHKTGFYLDQQENRHSIEPYIKGGRVLDCFAYTGAFALYAVKYGAKEVLALEDSGKVMEMLKRNILLNNFDNIIKAEKGDAFQWLRDRYKAGERFDCIMLDPPSFVKDKGARGGAARGYKDINLTALKLLNDGGFLITSSCSQNVSPDHFLDIIHDAAVDAGCLLQLMENRPQSKDHPILLSMPQTHYLKFVVVRKVDRR